MPPSNASPPSATAEQADLSAYHNGGAAAVNNVIDQVAAKLDDA